MSGYFGTPNQQRLQARAEASVDFINATPGACQAGRTMGCDDPDRLGWDRIDEFLARDGVCGFRLIPANKVDELKSNLTNRNCRFDSWDVFLADREATLAASEAILARGLPDGLTELDRPTDPEGEYTSRIQTLMAAAGVVPFSGSLLVGDVGPATTIAIGQRDGTVVAAAHGYLPHNAHSEYRGHAWGGLVAVAESHRGKRLGNYVNARMIVSVFRDLGATHVYELVSSTNLPSRRMVESCGLRFEPALVCGIATPNDSSRFTR
jgi:RimJ/RimL family protein N-acetyltransferase